VKTAARWLWIFAVAPWIVARAQTLPATQPAPRQWDLLSYGSADHFWYAVTTPIDSIDQQPPRTFVFERKLFEEQWRPLPNDQGFPGRLVAMGELRGQLIASLQDGEWKSISAEQFATRPQLPGRGNILALAAGEDGVVWAIGFADAAAAATQTATTGARQPSAVSSGARTMATAPATRPDQLQLFKLIGGSWSHVAPLPAEVRTARGQEISLVLFKGAPAVLYKSDGHSGDVIGFSVDQKRWTPLGSIHTALPIRKLKLLTARERLIGWAAGENGVGAFYFPQPPPELVWKEQALTVPSDVTVSDVSAAVAGAELRLLVIDADEQPREQKYDLDGREHVALKELPAAKSPNETTIGDMINWGVIGLLMVVTLVTANKSGAVQVVAVKNVQLALAPLALRLAAGLIDLWPMYVGNLLIVHHLQKGVKFSQVYTDRFVLWAVIIAPTIYVLHTAIAELVWGRSLGKMFVGLRVVGLDGKPPSVSAILLRNCMRVVEVVALVPLLVIFFNPLRQRVGDLTSGTVVVAKLPPPKAGRGAALAATGEKSDDGAE
jgi:uncharacterized RDD family membrane protein YckC